MGARVADNTGAASGAASSSSRRRVATVVTIMLFPSKTEARASAVAVGGFRQGWARVDRMVFHPADVFPTEVELREDQGTLEDPPRIYEFVTTTMKLVLSVGVCPLRKTHWFDVGVVYDVVNESIHRKFDDEIMWLSLRIMRNHHDRQGPFIYIEHYDRVGLMAGARCDLTIPKYFLIRDTNDADRTAWAERMSMVFDGTPTRWLGFVGIVNDGRGFLPEERSEIRPNVIRRPNEVQGHTLYFHRVSNMELVSRVTVVVLFRRSGARMVFLWLQDTSARHLKRLDVPFWSVLLTLARRMTDLYITSDLRLRWQGRVRRMAINEAFIRWHTRLDRRARATHTALRPLGGQKVMERGSEPTTTQEGTSSLVALASEMVEHKDDHAKGQENENERGVDEEPGTSVNTSRSPLMRENQVRNAIKFLSHPKVRGSPVKFRRAFLEKKGLSQMEIDEAFRRALVQSLCFTACDSFPGLPSSFCAMILSIFLEAKLKF
ncbi:hypothetical protein CBR_g10793 [Chara braunii]|uniref:Peroxisomal membrane protein PEX14 n=1 Tax=Chara braunii TaxID=69332 RepID=A0A388KP93_CHABU|nr:hypothetical protein CBR_g10793 [Chara braunii]|eukprot:GBG71855.1 hypothetical protein CBR_g10793 [Chara braunii]